MEGNRASLEVRRRLPILKKICYDHGMKEAEIEALREQLTGRREILFAILYGSAAEGEEYNDLDLAIFVDPAQVPYMKELPYAFALEDELQKVVPHPVDVRVINRAPLPFRFNVIRGIPLVIYDEDAYYVFRERTWKDYLDLEPLFRGYLRELI
jgi:uncharacterized protein